MNSTVEFLKARKPRVVIPSGNDDGFDVYRIGFQSRFTDLCDRKTLMPIADDDIFLGTGTDRCQRVVGLVIRQSVPSPSVPRMCPSGSGFVGSSTGSSEEEEEEEGALGFDVSEGFEVEAWEEGCPLLVPVHPANPRIDITANRQANFFFIILFSFRGTGCNRFLRRIYRKKMKD